MTDRALHLIARHLEGTLSDTERTELNDTLRTDPAARTALIQATLHARLLNTRLTIETTKAGGASAPPAPSAPPADSQKPHAPPTPEPESFPIYRKGCEPKSAISNFQFSIFNLQFQLLAATLLAACGLAAYLLAFADSPTPPRDPRSLIGPPVAVVVEADAVGWDTEPHNTGDELDTRAFAIYRGRLEVESLGGSTMQLIGPASAQLVSRTHARLISGGARFRSHPGFVVSTPGGVRVVDEGTAFDLWVLDDSIVRVQTTEGRVRVEPPESDPFFIDAGLAVLADPLDQPVPIAFDQSPVVRVRMRPILDEPIDTRSDVDAARWTGHHEDIEIASSRGGAAFTVNTAYRKFLRSFTPVTLDAVGDSLRAEFTITVDRGDIIHEDERTVAFRTGLFDSAGTDTVEDDHGYRLDLKLSSDAEPASAIVIREPAGPSGVLGGPTFGDRLAARDIKTLDNGKPHRCVLQLQRTAAGLRTLAWIDGEPVADHTTPLDHNEAIRFDRFGIGTGKVTGRFTLSPVRVTHGRASH